jgi:hypothetical protein
MATHSYIFRLEKNIMDAASAVDDARKCYLMEVEAERKKWPLSYMSYPENREVWATLALNALALQRKLELLVEAMRPQFGCIYDTKEKS